MTRPLKILILKRVSHTEGATFGVMIYNMIPFCVTLELPWRDNAQKISCVPEGSYMCFRRFSPRQKKDVYELKAVPGREYIQIHVGNSPRDTVGCICPGEMFEPVGKTIYAVRESARAFREIEQKLDGDDNFVLKIVGANRDDYIKF